ncbi:MAG: polymerase subunit beta [Streptosporangiaceae bacterium]|nr:polymerase subunit beta [Streptosporangiaceae bacterium]
MTAFTIPAGVLAAAADWAVRAAPAKTVIPIMQGILVDAGDQVTVSGFDYECRATVTVEPIAVATPGRFLVPGAFFAAVTKSATKGDDLRLEAAGSSLTVTAPRARWEVPLMPLEEYPALPDPGEPVGTVDAEVFQRALRRVISAASLDQTLPMLTGVKITADDEYLEMAATDRFRLTAARIPWKPGKPGQKLDVLISGQILKLTGRATDSGTLTLTTGDHNSMLGVATPTHLVTGRVLDAVFPKYRQLIPVPDENAPRYAKVSTADLIRAVAQVSPAQAKGVFHLVLEVDGDTLTVKVSDDRKSAEAAVPIESEGKPISIRTNGTWLDAALDCFTGEHVTVHFGISNSRPMLFQGDDPDYQHVLMPVKSPEMGAAA